MTPRTTTTKKKLECKTIKNKLAFFEIQLTGVTPEQQWIPDVTARFVADSTTLTFTAGEEIPAVFVFR